MLGRVRVDVEACGRTVAEARDHFARATVDRLWTQIPRQSLLRHRLAYDRRAAGRPLSMCEVTLS